MPTLRTAIATLDRFAPGDTVDISDVATFVDLGPPLSLRALVERLDHIPDAVPFHSTIETGAALGGNVDFVIRRDGSWTFSGGMRATGAFSYGFTLVAAVRSLSGGLVVIAQHSGRVYGTDTPGPRDNNWSESGNAVAEAQSIRDHWPDLSRGSLTVSRSSDLVGVFGTLTDVFVDLAEYVVGAATVGASVALCLVVGSELQRAGVELPGLGGIVGLGIVAGTVFIYGPVWAVPAIVAGAVAGAIVDSMVKIRPLTDAEIRFADTVFNGKLDYSRIRITNLSGLSTRAFTMPTVGHLTLLNIGNAAGSPVTSVDPTSYTVPGQIFIHELTHAWQIEHGDFTPGLICSGIYNQAVLGHAAYVPGPPGPPWHSFNLEAQAAIVDKWFAGITSPAKPAKPMDTADPYFGYVAGNIRTGNS